MQYKVRNILTFIPICDVRNLTGVGQVQIKRLSFCTMSLAPTFISLPSFIHSFILLLLNCFILLFFVCLFLPSVHPSILSSLPSVHPPSDYPSFLPFLPFLLLLLFFFFNWATPNSSQVLLLVLEFRDHPWQTQGSGTMY